MPSLMGSTFLIHELKESEYPWPYWLALSIRIDGQISRLASTFPSITLLSQHRLPRGSGALAAVYEPTYAITTPRPAGFRIMSTRISTMAWSFRQGVDGGVIEIPVKNLQVMTWWLAGRLAISR
ncbi:hypothetical protein OH492_08820 [Vibrio chagasii]|nr:hypothetical protein [Vibrio chagasii]